MLPDLPRLKRHVLEGVTRQISVLVNQKLGILGEVPRQILHEGDRMRIIRDDGSVDESPFHRSSAEDSIAVDEIHAFTIEDRARRMEELADQLAQQISQHMFGSLNKTLEEKGQTVDCGGKPLDPEAVFRLIEKLHIDFDEQGKPSGLSIIIPPQLNDQFQVCLKRIENEPELKNRFDALFERKRAEWRDREAARKLVG